ncbi:hypothetical protein [Limobrevibacterium gyesilva]|uniref:Uncharacterized protein n=1 Tax=Limobrevibacterium gyesilva TaxID=2991712 RepID=A0AA42CHM3_9PROT|nr:hypothetical protein [Limobrevibacterium gyesilva]MCW3477406.1 hypothetical protein [Limobrevibacterium gyesilva]
MKTRYRPDWPPGSNAALLLAQVRSSGGYTSGWPTPSGLPTAPLLPSSLPLGTRTAPRARKRARAPVVAEA